MLLASNSVFNAVACDHLVLYRQLMIYLGVVSGLPHLLAEIRLTKVCSICWSRVVARQVWFIIL